MRRVREGELRGRGKWLVQRYIGVGLLRGREMQMVRIMATTECCPDWLYPDAKAV